MRRLRHAPIIQKWFPQDELPQRALDDGGDWWAGAQRCFVGVALAGAVAALGTSVAIAGTFQHSDEIPRPPALDAGDYLPTAAASAAPRLVSLWADDDFAPTVAAAALDEGGWEGFRYTPPPIIMLAPADDEVLPPQPLTATGGGGLPFYGQRLRAETRFQRWAPPDDLPVPVAFVPDEEPAPNLPRSGDSVTFVVWATGDEIAVQPTALPIDELYWQPPTWNPVAPVPQVWSVDDTFAPLVAVPDDGYWLSLTAPPVQPVVRLWLDQDEITTPAVPLPVDEEPWPVPVRAAPPFIQSWTDSDDYPLLTPMEQAPVLGAAGRSTHRRKIAIQSRGGKIELFESEQEAKNWLKARAPKLEKAVVKLAKRIAKTATQSAPATILFEAPVMLSGTAELQAVVDMRAGLLQQTLDAEIARHLAKRDDDDIAAALIFMMS